MRFTQSRKEDWQVKTTIVLLLAAVASAFPASGQAKGGCIFSRIGKSRQEAHRPVHSRSLLQSSCSPQLSGTSYTFTACQDFSSTLGSSMTLHYSVTGGENGGNITLRGGIDAAHVAGESDYVGFGFQPDQEMIGGNAIIVQTCTTCESGASINDYYLSDQAVSGVNSPSRMSVPFKSAALSGGRFKAVFEVVLSSEQASLANAGIIYAAGPKSSSGAYQTHIYYGGQVLDMSPGVTSELGSALSPIAASAIAPAPASSSPPTASSASQAPVAAPRSALPACGIQYARNNSLLSFANCQDLTTANTVNSNLKLFWNLEPAGNGSLLRAALEVTSTNSWAGFAFPAQSGRMVGANAIIVRPCTSCSSGAEADRYLLASYQSSDINAGTGNLQVQSIEAAQRGGGGLQALFTLRLDQTVAEWNAAKSIIAAVGPSAGGRISSHPVENAFTGSVNFASGATIGGTSVRLVSKKVVAHGVLMIVGWGLLLPLGVVFARCKEWGQVWFQLHRAFQVIGYVAGAAGAGLGWSFGRPHFTHLEQNHRIVGWTVWLLLTIQMLSLFWRPKPGKNKLRTTWAGGHWFAGIASVFMAFANVFIGLRVTGQRKLWSGLYALAFGLIVLLWLLKSAYNVTVLKKRQKRSYSRQNLKDEGAPSRSSSDEMDRSRAKVGV